MNDKSIADRFTIILPTHSDYTDITNIFLQLLKKNWKNCPIRIIVSGTGKKTKIEGADYIYNGKNTSLIDCIINASKNNKKDYYICFLGDSFINKKINNPAIIAMLESIVDQDIDYCSLKPVKNYTKKKYYNEYYRLINDLDRYSHNFAAFIVSHKYLNTEMAKFKSDLEFEKFYLSKRTNHYYNNHLIVRKNYFGVVSGIVKGKWDIINKSKLKRLNPEIDFGNRESLTWKESVLRHARNRIVYHIKPSTRIRLKKAAEKAFKIKFGVES